MLKETYFFHIRMDFTNYSNINVPKFFGIGLFEIKQTRFQQNRGSLHDQLLLTPTKTQSHNIS